VTILGEFSPTYWASTLGSFFEKREVAQILGLLFSTVRVMFQYLRKNLGYILGNFFTNSSGHPCLQEKVKKNRERSKKTEIVDAHLGIPQNVPKSLPSFLSPQHP
jgi:hypothetical protein